MTTIDRTDKELLQLCAKAMGAGHDNDVVPNGRGSYWCKWNPLEDDTQAMALVKKFKLDVNFDEGEWFAMFNTAPYDSAFSPDANRAIVGCVAKMQAAVIDGKEGK